ncbi:unnamed protein product [Mytilus coruscus]|uniref:Mannosyltransferase n=1 Tax=Mytilus coruscus TaxID=42192 RepID=A0A6J8CW20_MYTCO|nr:unnamed protein product [Mytilus coruscus]
MSTHTLVNSFLSPLVYLIIADILERYSSRTLKTQHNKGNSSANNSNVYSSLCGVNNLHMYNEAQFKQIPAHCKTDHNANLPKLIVTSKNDVMSNDSTANMYLHTLAKKSGGRWFIIIKSVFSGFIFGLLVYVRPDTCAVILVVVAFTINFKRLKSLLCPYYLIGIILAISLGLRDDYVSYGSIIISPWQWIKFNVAGNLSAKLFGVEPTLFYLRRLLLDDWLNIILLTFTIFLFLLYAVYTVLVRHENSTPKEMWEVKMTKQLIIIILCLLCLYSAKGHKEIRFVHDVIPLILILYSKIIVVVCKLGSKLCKIKQFVYLIVSLTAAIEGNIFISLNKSTISKWSYRGIDNSNHVNNCLDFISRQQNVTGVFLDADFHMSGGFSILRHNVSVLALNQKEYLKFGEDARIIVNPNFRRNGTNSIFTLSRISDFISVTNQRYLWKSIIDSNINYLIVAGRRLLIDSAFVEIYTYGDFKILKRTFDSITEQALSSFANNSSLVNNPVILNMEADWLIYYGSYISARQRLTYSFKIDEQNLKSHQLIIQLYHIKGDNKSTRAALQECRKYYERKICLQTPNHNHMK